MTSKKPDDAIPESEAVAFYRHLEQAGQLADVPADIDPATLPPRITHIRRPNGTIERIRFHTSPYTGSKLGG